jgi:hypothetical protein
MIKGILHNNRFLHAVPWLGMLFLQLNSIPAIIAAIQNGTSTPIGTVLLTLAGLSCYMVRAISDRDPLYITGNSIGIIGNIILLTLIF